MASPYRRAYLEDKEAKEKAAAAKLASLEKENAALRKQLQTKRRKK